MEKAQDFEEDVRLPGSKVAEEAEGRAELVLPPLRGKNAGCKVGAVLPGCSSHLTEETLAGKARVEFLEGEGNPTSSCSSQGRHGLWAPATGRPGGAKALEARPRTEPGRAARPQRTGGSGSRPEQRDRGGGAISASYRVRARRRETRCAGTGGGGGSDSGGGSLPSLGV